MPIFDAIKKIIPGSKKPVYAEVAAPAIYDKYSTYPSNGLTPERLARIFKEADVGNVYRQMELFEEMEEKDPHLFSVLQTRKNAIIGTNFDVLPFSDEPRDKEIADFIADCINNIASIEDIFTDLSDAISKGFSVGEIMWGFDEGKVVVKDILWRHQKKFFFDDHDVMKVMTEENPEGIELPPNKFIVHKYKAKSGHPSRAGVLRVCAWMYLFKNYDVKDWVAFTEVYGMPLRLGKYGPNTSEADKDALMKALVMLGSDAAGIISDSTSVEFHEANKSSSQSIYESLANFCNAEMSKAILGQTLTTEVGSSGSYAASKTHDGVRQDLKEADCKSLAQTLLRDLIRPLCFFNFGETQRLPWIKFHYEEAQDLKELADTYSVLVKDIRLPISTEHIYETFGIPKPEEGQELIKPDAPAPIMAPQAMKDDVKVLELKDAKGDKLQEGIDTLADNALKASIPILKKLYEPIARAMDEASSLEELRDKLPSIYEKMNTKELEDLVSRAMFVADLTGRMKEYAQDEEE